MWAFTVDDALIAVRYAQNLAHGFGWRFNAPGGVSSDGVTSLVWPLILLPWAHGPALSVLARAKVMGLIVWAATGAGLGLAIGRVRPGHWVIKIAALFTLALSVPVAAYAVSGMETPMATALATWAAISIRRPRTAALLAGLSALFRPEMVVWAAALTLLSTAGVRRNRRGAYFVSLALSLAPFLASALVRAVLWGRPYPLAVLAKPGSLDQGFPYVGAACIVTLLPLAACAPVSLFRDRSALAIALAAVAHGLTVALVGGDWMPFARLMVPVVPSLAMAIVLSARRATCWSTVARFVVAMSIGSFMLARGGAELGRHVGGDRAALIASAKPWLAEVASVAALDVGWVGAATGARVLDLAGLTDPDIAALPGGHTSKRVDSMFLLRAGVEALLVYAPRGLPGGSLSRWPEVECSRVVEARLVRDPVIALHFGALAWLPLGSSGAGYVFLKRDLRTDSH